MAAAAAAAALVSSVYAHTATAETPALRPRGCESSFLPLYFSLDRFAHKSAFFNAGSALRLCDNDQTLRPPTTMRIATTSGGTYICRDCGYIYSERRPFEKLPDDFFCPVCGAPKRRFKPYNLPVTKNSNQVEIRKARKEQLKRDAALGSALPIALAIGLAGLLGTYFFLNTQY